MVALQQKEKYLAENGNIQLAINTLEYMALK